MGAALHAAVAGVFPPDDGAVELVEPWQAGVEAVVSFTGHAIVASTLPRSGLVDAGVDAYTGAFAPQVLTLMAGDGGEIDCVDLILISTGTGRTTLPERASLVDHPRVRHARRWREDVHVHADERGLVTVSRGLGGVAELSFEVTPGRRGEGIGRELLGDARGLVAFDEPVIVLAAPGNARSVRAALAAGFVPIGAAQRVRPGRLAPAAPALP